MKLGWLAFTVVVACRRDAAPARDVIPRATGAIQIDGHWEEPDWSRHALRGQFRAADGELARPASEVRLLRDDTDLLVALYAADENIESTDAFDVAIAGLALHVDAAGKVTPPSPEVRTAVDYDEGTRDDPRDDDEEWVVELAIPLAIVGSHPQVRTSRCDVPKDKIRRCGSWSATLTVER